MTDEPKRAANEYIKDESRQLRGTIVEGLENEITGSISEDDTQLVKFHGTYMQDDRDLRPERAKKKMEKAFSFMIRVRVPGGVATADQWIAMDDIADTYANGTLRLTTRQAFQFHGVIKNNLKSTMQAINNSLLDTLAACGDVNRNVMSTSNPYLSAAHKEAFELATRLSAHLSPQTGAYHEIWLDGDPVDVAGQGEQEEPLYGKHYLPRKFKTVIAVPPDNDVDVFAHCLGYIAIVAKDKLVGYNVTVGGGMGTTHGEPDTFPRTADVMGFCTPKQAVEIGEAVLTVQRDWGNRINRKRARLKYTVEDRGVDAFRAEVEKRVGYKMGKPRKYKFERTGDVFGWRQTQDKKWHLTMSIDSGRVKDQPGWTLKSALRQIAEKHKVEFILSNNQNLLIVNIPEKSKAKIEKIFADNGVSLEDRSGIHRNAMACVALPTCALALAESERFLPELVQSLETELEAAGLRDDDIILRMTGCPNGCARPFLAEIGLVGKGPGKYNLYLGAAFDGSRLNKLYAEGVEHEKIIELLRPLFQSYAKKRENGERFGDFVIRTGVIKATTTGNQFHNELDLAS